MCCILTASCLHLPLMTKVSSPVFVILPHIIGYTLLTLNALRPDDVGGLMCGILHPGSSDAQLLHDPVQQPLDVGFRHLVRRAGAAGWSQAELKTQEEAEQR